MGRKLWIPDGGRITHRVRPGETLDQIARIYRVRVSTITSANRLGRFGKIAPGAWLVMPSDATLPRPPPSWPRATRFRGREASAAVSSAPAERPAPDPALTRAEALVDEATEHYRSARFERALESTREAEALLAKHGDARAARTLGARAAFVAGSAQAGLGDRDRAIGSYARVRALDPDFEPPPGWLSPRLEALYREARAE